MNENKDLPLISVIIPVYNVAEFLPECIQSVLNQTYHNLEIILVDDGSTDNSGEICDNFKSKDDRITVIHQTNGGLSAARNAGTSVACGEYVTYIDSDDYVSSELINILFNTLSKNNAEIACCGTTRNVSELNSGTNSTAFYNTDKALIEMFYDRNILASACAKLYKKSLMQAVKFEEGRIYEDYLFSINIASKSNGIAVVDKMLYFYRVNNSSITQVKFTQKNFDVMHGANQAENIIRNYNPRLLKYAYIRRCHLALNMYVQCCLANMTELYGKEIRKEIRAHYFRFLFSNKPIKRKILATLILVCPKTANNKIRKRNVHAK